MNTLKCNYLIFCLVFIGISFTTTTTTTITTTTTCTTTTTTTTCTTTTTTCTTDKIINPLYKKIVSVI